MVFRVLYDFFSTEEEVGGMMGPSSGKTSLKYFILVSALQLAHIVIQLSAILAVLSSIRHDLEYNEHLVRKGQVQFFERNDEELVHIFGDAWRRKLCRVSSEQVVFFVGASAWGILYVVNVVHFLIYPNFRVRIVWTGFFHCIVLLMDSALLVFLLISYFRINEELKWVVHKIHVHYTTPSAQRRMDAVEPYHSLIENEKPIFYYCKDGTPSEALQRRMDESNLCPAEAQRLFALSIVLLDVLLIFGTILTIIAWHYSAREIAEFGEVEQPNDKSGRSSASSLAEADSPRASLRVFPEASDDPAGSVRSKWIIASSQLQSSPPSSPPPPQANPERKLTFRSLSMIDLRL